MFPRGIVRLSLGNISAVSFPAVSIILIIYAAPSALYLFDCMPLAIP